MSKAESLCDLCQGRKYKKKFDVTLFNILLTCAVFYGAYQLFLWGYSLLILKYSTTTVFKVALGSLMSLRLFFHIVRHFNWSEWREIRGPKIFWK